MNYLGALFARAAATLVVVLFASAWDRASATTVFCPGTAATTDREFSLTTTPGATCLASGSGNINGNGDAITSLGYVLLDKSDDVGSGLLSGSLTFTPPTSGLSGTFSISAPGYTNFVLGIKSGGGQLDPEWAAFLLPNGVVSGSWAITGSQALSHANLYGQVCLNCGGGPGPVPLPGALPLFGTALLGGGLARIWRRRRNSRSG